MAPAENEYTGEPGDRRTGTVVMWQLTESQWTRLSDISIDPEDLCDTYEEWLDRERERREDAVAKGNEVTLHSLDLDDLIDWCEERGIDVDAHARERFGLELASRDRA